MGWLFCKSSKEALVNHLLDPNQYSNVKIVDHALRGNHLWIQFEQSDGKRLVGLCLLGSSRRAFPTWGYKDMDETMHPYYYDCPLRLIDTATEPLNEGSAKWREAVREYWKKKASKPRPIMGMRINYGGVSYVLNEKAQGNRRGWVVTRISDGQLFRMKAHQVSAALKEAA
jgi:hypothetical protein